MTLEQVSGPAVFCVLTPFSYSISRCDQVQSHILTGLLKSSENEKENVLFLIIQPKSLPLVWTKPTTLTRGIECSDGWRPEMHASFLEPQVEPLSNR